MSVRSLSVAVMNGNQAEVDRFLKENADVNEANGLGWTPLHFAISSYHRTISWEIVNTLINYRADLTAETGIGRTPLHTAAIRGNVKVAKMLLQAKANVCAVDLNGKRPFDIAKGMKTAYLLGKEDGLTPLMIASVKGNSKQVALILERLQK